MKRLLKYFSTTILNPKFVFNYFWGRYITVYEIRKEVMQGNAISIFAIPKESKFVLTPFAKMQYNLKRLEYSHSTNYVVVREIIQYSKKENFTKYDYEW